jgi:hypothetical protein
MHALIEQNNPAAISLMFPQSWRHQAPGLLGWERTEKILDGCLFYSDLLFGLV